MKVWPFLLVLISHQFGVFSDKPAKSETEFLKSGSKDSDCGIRQWSTNFPKMWELPKNYRHKRNEIRQVSCRLPKSLDDTEEKFSFSGDLESRIFIPLVLGLNLPPKRRCERELFLAWVDEQNLKFGSRL
jgi:hypothetical protein